MTYVALLAVLVWLLIYYRNIVKMVLPLVPTLIAVGISSTAIYGLGITMSPLTALSGPLIVATCTEFSVLLMARYFEERERGLAPDDAITRASARIGRPFTAAGLTTVAGFAALAFSGFPLLTGFGLVTGISVGVALVSTLVVLPPLLVLADRTVALDNAGKAE
jgi:predicted RND superfamily exporter protein